MRWRVWSAAGLLAVSAAVGLAQPKRTTGKTYTFTSRAYHITTDVDKDLAKEIGAHVDAVFNEYNAKFQGMGQPIRSQFPLYVFTTQAAYMKLLAEKGADGTGTGGMFFGGDTLAAFIGDQGLERMFHTLRHEGFHQFARVRIGDKLPTWCNEGIAEYFGEAILVKGKLQTGQVPVEKLAYVQAAVKDDKHIPFNTLLNMSNAVWNNTVKGGSGQLQYEQSWSIIQFLAHGDARYRNALNAYLKQVSTGADSNTAFAKSFGTTDYKPFEAAWKKYILALTPNPETTAARRLGFIASGMAWLHKDDQAFASLDELKQKLRARKFGMRYGLGSGAVIDMVSSDEANFQAPDSGNPKKPATLEWEPATGSDGKLPGLAVKGLKYTVRLTWTKDAETGEPVSKIVYE